MRLRTKYKRLKRELAALKGMPVQTIVERERYDCCDLEFSKIYDTKTVFNIPERVLLDEIADGISKAIVENELIEYQRSHFLDHIRLSGRVKVLRRKT